MSRLWRSLKVEYSTLFCFSHGHERNSFGHETAKKISVFLPLRKIIQTLWV